MTHSKDLDTTKEQVGDIVHIQVDEKYGYDMVIRAIEKGGDDGSIPLNKY